MAQTSPINLFVIIKMQDCACNSGHFWSPKYTCKHWRRKMCHRHREVVKRLG